MYCSTALTARSEFVVTNVENVDTHILDRSTALSTTCDERVESSIREVGCNAPSRDSKAQTVANL